MLQEKSSIVHAAKNVYSSVAAPPAPLRVPSQLPFVPSNLTNMDKIILKYKYKSICYKKWNCQNKCKKIQIIKVKRLIKYKITNKHQPEAAQVDILNKNLNK